MAKYVEIEGSATTPLAGAVRGEPVAADQSVRVSVLVRRRRRRRGKDGGAVDSDRPHLSREEFRALYGADPAELENVAETLQGFGLKMTERDEARRTIWLEGPVSAANAAFNVQLSHWSAPDGVTYLGYDGPLYVPASIAPLVEGVFGLDDRPQARPHLRKAPAKPAGALGPRNTQGYTPIDITSIYQFPPGTSGAGQTIGLIELGGGFLQSDIDSFFQSLNIEAPKVVAVMVDMATNSPAGTANDDEVALDIQVAGGCAPGATIVVYFAPNTAAGFVDAVTAAVNDTTNNPSVISISWGNPENAYAAMTRTATESAFIDAAAIGVTVCVASGDRGASGLTYPDGQAHVDFPASAPHALACGGTELQIGQGTPFESVWNEGSGGASGGGISAVFSVPSYQMGLSLPAAVNPGAGSGRGVPDVAGNAASGTGYQVIVHGKTEVIGGTSAVAPLWAALIARLNEALGGQLGFIHPRLYRLRGNAVFTDILLGNNDVGNDNGGYSATAGWDCCTGLGTPLGILLLRLLEVSKLSQFFAPNEITCGYSDTGRIFIDKPYADDLHIQLKSDDPATVSVPAVVVISAGSMSTTVKCTALVISGPFPPKLVNVHATYGGKTLTAAVEVVPPRVVSVALSPESVTCGDTSLCTVTLDRASLKDNVTLELFCESPGFATIPQSLIISQGSTSGTFTVNTPSILVPFRTAHVSIVAIYQSSPMDPGTSAMATLTVHPQVVTGILKSLVVSPTEISQGGHSYGVVTLEQAVSTPTTVALAALDAGSRIPLPGTNSNIVTVPESITIPAYQTQGQFTITARQSPIHGSKEPVTIMAGAVVTRTATLTIDL